MTSQSHAGKKVSSYSIEYKLEAIKFAEESKSISSAAKKFNVDRKRIRLWQSAKAKLQAADNKRKRLDRGGRKPFDVSLEDELLEWIHERRSSGLRVSRAMISHKARAIHEQKCKARQVSPSFIASNGWLQKCMARNGLSVRRRTTESKKGPDRLIDKLIAYILQVRRQRNRHSYNLVPRVSHLPAPWSERGETLVQAGHVFTEQKNSLGTSRLFAQLLQGAGR